MFTVFFVTSGYSALTPFKTLENALKYVEEKGYSAQIYFEGELSHTWNPINGTKAVYVQ